MPNYRFTLQQNLPNRPPSAFQATYTYRNAPAQNWIVHMAGNGPFQDTSVVTLSSGTDLVNQRDVASRTLKAFYPVQPSEVDISISSVMPG